MEIYSGKKTIIWTIVDILLNIGINALVLKTAELIFKGFHISSFKYAILASMIIMVLNKTVKPILKILTMPITVLTLGIIYPFIDVLILKITGLILKTNFIIDGWFVPFFIAIFISFTSVLIETIISKCLKRSIK